MSRRMPSAADVAACRLDRITSQSGRITITDADREVCTAKLDTCTCAALDLNDLDACGFDGESFSHGNNA